MFTLLVFNNARKNKKYLKDIGLLVLGATQYLLHRPSLRAKNNNVGYLLNAYFPQKTT